MVYCIVPRELAPRVQARLQRLLSDDPDCEVIVERRCANRRGGVERRAPQGTPTVPLLERRRIRSWTGRRCGERRGALLPVRGRQLSLPRSIQRLADRVSFVQRAPETEHALEDIEVARVVTRVQAGDTEAFADLYLRYFDRLWGYMRLALRNVDEAEDATQHVFMKVLEAMPAYERRTQPFRAWLFRIARNHAVDRLRDRGRVDVEEPGRLELLASGVDAGAGSAAAETRALEWLSDDDMLMFVERLPLAQRQVLVLRYMLDLSTAEIAEVLDRSEASIRQLQSRALRRLENQVGSLGPARPRRPESSSSEARPMRLALSQLVSPRSRFEHGFSVAAGF
jgi:RNA polymerase sigma-70 factor (ECF subfamily)